MTNRVQTNTKNILEGLPKRGSLSPCQYTINWLVLTEWSQHVAEDETYKEVDSVKRVSGDRVWHKS